MVNTINFFPPVEAMSEFRVTTSLAPAEAMAAAVASTTPASRPRQPACTAATIPSGLARPTAAQSAEKTASGSPGSLLTSASASRPSQGSFGPRTTTPLPWH